MSYQVQSTEIEINYAGTSYVVTLTPASAPGSFRIKSPSDGSSETVDANTAAHLFGAEQAYSLLVRMYSVANIDQTPSYWANVLQSDAQILGWSGASTVLANLSGLALGSLLTDGVSATSAAGSFLDIAHNLTPSLAELTYTAAAVQDATSLLNQATNGYDAIQATLNNNRNTAISYDSIKAAADDLLIAFNTGNAATQAASQIPIVSQSSLDDVFGFVGSFIGSFTGAVKSVDSIFSAAQLSQLDNAKSATDLIGVAGDENNLGDLINSIDSVNSLLTSDTYRYAPLTYNGLVASANALQGQPLPIRL
jgi:hypothetical protein